MGRGCVLMCCSVWMQLRNQRREQEGGGSVVVGRERGRERERERERERLLPLLLRLIKTAPTFLLNHPASHRTKHFYQCLYLGKQ